MKTYPFKCPRCGYMRLERIGDWEGCERRQCGYQAAHDKVDVAITLCDECECQQ